MKTETFGWIVLLPLAGAAIILYLNLPFKVGLFCLFVTVALLARLFVGRRM